MKRLFYTLICATALGSASGQPAASWNFNNESFQADSGHAVLDVARVLPSFAAGYGTGRSLSLRSFAPQGTESGQRGLILEANTVGFDSVWLTGALRGSSTASRWWRIDASTDSGATWSAVWAPDSGWGPFDTWVGFHAPLVGVGGQEYLLIRLVSVFAPVAFSNFGGSFGPNQAYQGLRTNPTSSSQNYSTSGTWRWDNLTLRGREAPATVWNGQSWSLGPPALHHNARIQGPYSGTGFTCANLRVDSGQLLDLPPGGSIDVRGRLYVDGGLALRADSLGQAQLRLGSAGYGSGMLSVETFWPYSGWQQISAPLDGGISGAYGVDSAKLYVWHPDSGEYRRPGEGLGLRGVGAFGFGRGRIGLRGRTPKKPWSSWDLGYANLPNPSSTSHSTAVTDGWNLIGNPLLCTIDFTKLQRQGVDASYSIWNPSLMGGAGGYEFYSPSGGSLSPLIRPLQAFWVRSQSAQAELTLADRGTLGAGMLPSSQIRIQLQDAADSGISASVWLHPDPFGRAELDLEWDAPARSAAAPLVWTIETPTGAAASKRWNPKEGLVLRTEVGQPRRLLVSVDGATGPLWLVGGSTAVRIDQGPSELRCSGTQYWSLVSAHLGSPDQADGLRWGQGGGIFWAEGAHEVRVHSLAGHELLRQKDLNGGLVRHNLPEGLYLIHVRTSDSFFNLKTLLSQ